jgi:predicted GNAT family N-acyltransferase
VSGATNTFIVELLSREHDRDGFDCGDPDLNRYLKTQARQEMDRGATVAYVLLDDANRRTIAGFYTLSASSVRASDWPDSVRKKWPRYPLVPVTLIGRLAVGVSWKGRGLGERLLVDALQRCHTASHQVGSVAVIVDAKDPAVAGFYSRYGFIPFPQEPLRLFLPMKTIAALVASK